MSIKKLSVRGLAVLALSAGCGAQAQSEDAQTPYGDAAGLFEEACYSHAYDMNGLTAAAESNEAWTSDDVVDVDVEALEISRAISRNYDFSDPVEVRQWSRTVDGNRVRLVLASFEERERYESLCAVIFPDVRNAMPYRESFDTLMDTYQVDRKSVDLVHYFEYADRIGPARNRVRAEIFSRSQSLGRGNRAMHLYVAF